MDPHSENYYNWSPYAYVANNPMKLIDPTGMTIWQLDQMGKIINTINNDEIDRIEVLGNKNQLLASSGDFTYDTINQETVDRENVSYNIFTIKGDDNAKNVFETLANSEKSTKSEWAWTTFRTQEGTVKHYVSTSSQGDTEESGGYLVSRERLFNNPLYRHIHNHPLDSPKPSGLEPKFGKLEGDINVATIWSDRNQKAFGFEPTFFMYDHIRNSYIPYNKNSRSKDFNYGPKF